MIGVPQWDIVLKCFVAAQRLVACTLKIHVILELLTGEAKDDPCPLSCVEGNGRDKAFRSVDTVEGRTGVTGVVEE